MQRKPSVLIGEALGGNPAPRLLLVRQITAVKLREHGEAVGALIFGTHTETVP